MVIAVVATAMVQVATHQIVGVVTMGYRLVPTAGAMHVRFFMLAAVVCGRTRGRIRSADRDPMLFYLASAGVVQTTVMQVIGMTIVLDGKMAAV